MWGSGSGAASAESVASESAGALAVGFGVLGLLVRSENLIERRVGLGIIRGDLGRQIADGDGSLVDARAVVGLHGVGKALVRCLQVGAHGGVGRGGVRKDGR